MSTDFRINIEKTALVVIDLQKGIVSMQTEPHSSKVVIENTVKILTEARRRDIPVFLVHVTPSPNLKDALRPVSETSYQKSKYD